MLVDFQGSGCSMNRWLFRLVVAAWLFVPLISLAAPDLSNRDAARILQQAFDGDRRSVPLGSFDVVRSGWDWRSGSMSVETFGWVQAAARAGLLTYTIDQSYARAMQGQQSDWSQFFAMSQRGTLAKIVVKDTSLGSKYTSQENANWRAFPTARYSSIEAVQNDYRQAGADEYRIVRVKYRAELEPISRFFSEISGRRISTDQIGAILFKWSAFDSRWMISDAVYGNAGDQLNLGKINSALTGAPLRDQSDDNVAAETKRILAAVASASPATPTSQPRIPAPALPTEEAREMVQKLLSRGVQIPYGTFSVVASGAQWTAGTINGTTWAWAQAAARHMPEMARVELHPQQDAANLPRVTIQYPARPDSVTTPNATQLFEIAVAKISNLTIESNSEYKRDSDVYRLIRYSYNADLEPVGRIFDEIIGTKREAARRAASLFRWDGAKWQSLRHVVANGSERLDMEPIQKVLGQI